MTRSQTPRAVSALRGRLRRKFALSFCLSILPFSEVFLGSSSKFDHSPLRGGKGATGVLVDINPTRALGIFDSKESIVEVYLECRRDVRRYRPVGPVREVRASWVPRVSDTPGVKARQCFRLRLAVGVSGWNRLWILVLAS
jgi:hypothetical protein